VVMDKRITMKGIDLAGPNLNLNVMKPFHLNFTTAYHRNGLETLGWELTLCNALHPETSPCRNVLKRDVSYGEHLYDYLACFIPMDQIRQVIEIGGGYGFLMRAFFEKDPSLQVSMLDISPYLIGRQKDTLNNFHVNFIENDFLETAVEELLSFELAILNENLGDFPTLVDLPADLFKGSSTAITGMLNRARYFFDRYDLIRPDERVFNLNIGALDALEKCCLAGIPNIFLGEHSCEAQVPESYLPYIKVRATGNPERISLYGHDEYTIKFSHLEKIARTFGYRIIRGPFADILPFEFTDRLRCLMNLPSPGCDEHEIIRHFVTDLFQYEYLLLTTELACKKRKGPSSHGNKEP
jgi:hypothetical protein